MRPKMVADMKSWKDRVREGSLRAFHHKGEFAVHGAPRADRRRCSPSCRRKLGYKFVTREIGGGATLIAAKRGALTKFGYISAHLAIVVICLGGLLDSNLPIKLQMWLFDKIADPRQHGDQRHSAGTSPVAVEPDVSAATPGCRKGSTCRRRS